MSFPDARKILVINLGGMGDILLSLPAIRALLASKRDAAVTILVAQSGRAAVEWLLPECDARMLTLSRLWDVRRLFNNCLLLLQLRRQRYACAINMRSCASRIGAFKMAFLLWIINPEKCAGRNTAGRSPFFDSAVEESDRGEKSESAYDIDTVEALGISVVDRAIHVTVPDEDRSQARQFLAKLGIDSKRPVIGVHPGGKASHRWPWQRYLELMKKVQGACGGQFIITGSSAEHSLAERLVRGCPQSAVSVCGKLSLGQLAALISCFHLFIANDTGPMHIAAVLRVPLVAVFGPGYIRRFDPRLMSDRAALVYKDTACAPCNKRYCSHMRCLNALTTEEVFSAAMTLLDNGRGSHA
jgi:ADP-heptose:LPS heptosyltransferase